MTPDVHLIKHTHIQPHQPRLKKAPPSAGARQDCHAGFQSYKTHGELQLGGKSLTSPEHCRIASLFALFSQSFRIVQIQNQLCSNYVYMASISICIPVSTSMSVPTRAPKLSGLLAGFPRSKRLIVREAPHCRGVRPALAFSCPR